MTLKVKLDQDAIMPFHAHMTDAGYDLHCREDFILWPGHHVTFDTGVHVELPDGWYARVENRSGLNVKDSVVCCGSGIIDQGYTGSICVKLYNLGKRDHEFHKGDRIAQLVFSHCEAPALIEVSKLDETERGQNGFGSSGK